MMLLPLTFCQFLHRLSHCGGVYCYSLIGHMTSFYSLEIFLRTKERVFPSLPPSLYMHSTCYVANVYKLIVHVYRAGMRLHA